MQLHEARGSSLRKVSGEKSSFRAPELLRLDPFSRETLYSPRYVRKAPLEKGKRVSVVSIFRHSDTVIPSKVFALARLYFSPTRTFARRAPRARSVSRPPRPVITRCASKQSTTGGDHARGRDVFSNTQSARQEER